MAGVPELGSPGGTCGGANGGADVQLLVASTSIILGGAGTPSRDRDETVGDFDFLAFEGSWPEPAAGRPCVATERSAK